MKFRVEIDENLIEDEVIIRCRQLNQDILDLQKSMAATTGKKFEFFKGNTSFYLQIDDILFFQTDAGTMNVHTADDVFTTTYCLYELEDMLPGSFVRIAKSTIINCDRIYSIDKNITSSSLVKFQNSYKQVYVSRMYYKALKEKMERIGSDG